MATIKFIATTQDRLKDLPIAAGQLIFATDKQTVYLDTNVRTAFEQIITVPTEQFRKSISSPVETFYFVNETKVLWQYENNEWFQLTNSPKENIIFEDRDNFPEVGTEGILYVTKNNIYRWNNNTHSYTILGGSGSSAAEWQDLTN